MRAPRLATLLLRLIRGPGSEFLRGDLEEWMAEEQGRRAAGHPSRSPSWEVLRSALAWWRPRAVRSRRADSRRGDGPFGGLGRDLRVTVRSLRRRPGYASLVIAVMAAGIGATTTVLTVVDRVLIRALPYPEADRLAVIGSTFPDSEWREDAPDLQHLVGFSLLNFLEWEARGQSFERVGAIENMGILLSDRGAGPELVQTAAVTPGFLDILQVRPALGRSFLPQDFRSGAPDVVLISHSAWTSRYGRDPGVIGTTLGAEQGAAEIIGVLPPDLAVPEVLADQVHSFWFPMELDADRYADRGRRSLTGLALLRPGVTVERAREELATISFELAEAYPDGNVYPDGRRLGAGVNGLRSHTVGSTRRPIVLFLGAACLLLLIAGLNASNLLLVRGLARHREIGVRMALGAGRRRILRLFVGEAVLLSLAGGAAGLALAAAGVFAFRTLAPATVPRLAEVGLDARIALATVVVTVGSGLFTGLVPALRLVRTKSTVQRIGVGSRSTARAGAGPWTVGAQVALSMLLMVAAGLLMESVLRLRTFDPGFEPHGALTFEQGLKRPAPQPEPLHQLWDDALAQMEGLPMVSAAAAASRLPYQPPNWAPWLLLPGDGPDSHRTGIAGYVVTSDYFDVVGIPLLAGRGFERTDGPDGPPVVIVNEAFVDTQAAGTDVVGSTVRMREGDSLRELQVVGVVGNTVQGRPEDGLLPAVYVPYTQVEWPSIWVFARLETRAIGIPVGAADEVRRRMAVVNPYVPPQAIGTMVGRIGATRTEPQFNAALALAFGLVSLLLSAGGLYGALSFGVRRRTQEIGVRMALGATRGSVAGLVVRQGVGVTLVGIVAGLGGALLVGPLMTVFLFGVRPYSPVTLGAVATFLLLVAALASTGPALKAMRVDASRSLNTG